MIVIVITDLKIKQVKLINIILSILLHMSEYFFSCSEKKFCMTTVMNVFLDAGIQTMAFAL